MTRTLGNTEKRFSIDDAFEEETDEAIKVYGATVDRSPIQNKFKNGGDFISSKTYKYTEDTTSRDSDSLIHEYVEASQSLYCWNHPKVRENWKTVCAAVILLIVGVGLLGMCAFAVAEPENGLQGAVFFVAGMICFVPGAYHVVYIWLAARGQRGLTDIYNKLSIAPQLVELYFLAELTGYKKNTANEVIFKAIGLIDHFILLLPLIK